MTTAQRPDGGLARLLSASELASVVGASSSTGASNSAYYWSVQTNSYDEGYIDPSQPGWSWQGDGDGTGGYAFYHNSVTGDWGWGDDNYDGNPDS